MKNIFTLLITSLFSLSLLAYDGSRLSISTVTDLKLRVEVDGRKYNMTRNVLSIGDLSPGYHSIKIYRDKKKSSGWFGNRQEQVYSSSVYLKEGHHFDITINRFGKALIDERRIDRNDDWYNDDDEFYNGDKNFGNDRDDVFGKEMSYSEFANAKETLKREFFENSRVSLAKQIIDRNYFNSSQVREILQLFSFENNKLDLAKYAYNRTTDKRNYYVVNDVFNHSNSKDELARFIRNQ